MRLPAAGCGLYASVMLCGTITRLDPTHGFGFIVDDSHMDWFFVQDGVRGGRLDVLRVGARVRFAEERTRSGPRASDIHHEQAG